LDCPLCQYNRTLKLFEKQGASFFRCQACDFLFARSEVNPNLANDLSDYEETYLDYLGDSPEDEANHSAFLRWVESYRLINDDEVLDVGSGSGKFVRFLRGRGIAAYGIEPAAALYSRFLAAEDCFSRQTIEELAAASPHGRFAVIVASDVIEHVERPDLFLCNAARLLKPDGLLFVSTPDVSSFGARIFGRSWHYFHRYHLSYLSRRTIGALAEAAGLQEVAFTRLPRLKSARYLLNYLVDALIGAGRIRFPARLDKLLVPINLYDTMYVAFAQARQTEISHGNGASRREGESP